jgi:chromosome segregation ATPase
MYLKSVELIGFKSFGRKCALDFSTPITSIVGPNGSGKSNTAEAFRFVLGEQSMKSLRGKRGEDLIWGGSTEVPRSNRASVKAVFDNTKRLLDVDFDEVVIERVVYRDGTNEYLINGSKVRLKDVMSLLSGANIGFSGHHIISQGEADRIIAASPKERRQMIEDALGLRVYQNKKEESLKKLEKTEENKLQVDSLRRENIPHLKFLERQVKKLEKARALREELVVAYHEYLKREEEYLGLERETIQGMREEPTRQLRDTEDKIQEVRRELEKTKKGDKESEQILQLQKKLSDLREKINEHTRAIGRIEGQIAFEERRIDNEIAKLNKEEGQPVAYKEARDLWETLLEVFEKGEDESLDVSAIRKVLVEAKKKLQVFVDRHLVAVAKYEPDLSMLEKLQREKTDSEDDIKKLSLQVQEQELAIRRAREEIEKGKDENREMERELFSLMTKQTTLSNTLSNLVLREQSLRREEDEFKREISEGVALIGRHVQGYKEYVIEDENKNIDGVEERSAQLERRRELEKMKIRLEEIGGASADEIMKEYTEVQERDAFLAKELDDLEKSAELLRKLISDLENELSEKFKQGLAEIGAQFNSFFTLMFDGGKATLSETASKKKTTISDFFSTDNEEDSVEEEEKSGVDIEISLPKKRIQSLMMLSGGERALTSIALIFAMSQVNPPPFLILDETDAALDEANSRRYGDMITNLSQKSQLILITHNRETMSRADVLYGITMGADGVSRILSVKFDDAVAVAK